MARFVFLMLDGLGVGALPDASDYGDAGSDTLGNLSRIVDLHLPCFQEMGLGNILPVLGVPPVRSPRSLPGRLAPLSAGKDTTVGHWEHMGLVTQRAFPTYPGGFPEEVLEPFRKRIGRGVLGNKPASGTAIIAELGEEHLALGWPIVYTSADSVFQIATHVDVVPLDQLYEWCEIARALLQGPHAVARVIARPFTGRPGEFTRTKDRRDFSLAAPQSTYLDLLMQSAVPVIALGKISEVFLGRGITTSLKVKSNEENLSLVIDLLRGSAEQARFTEGLLFTNLVDFDMIWGHRNDCDGFAQGLTAVDSALPRILESIAPEDRLIITADHGVDPTTPSTDHSREYVPMLLYPRPRKSPSAVYEGGFADTGATVYSHLVGGEPPLAGRVITDLNPSRGWREYTAAQSSPSGRGPALPGRVGSTEVAEAARWLRAHAGAAPRWALVLGSGLAPAFSSGATGVDDLGGGLGPNSAPSRAPKATHCGGSWSADICSKLEISYADVPHWRSSTVSGHPNRLRLADWNQCRLAMLEGRLHSYEGFDLSELQLQVRTLAAWGVESILLTSSAGAVAPRLRSGDLIVAREVLDFQSREADGSPSRLTVADSSIVPEAAAAVGARTNITAGVHAAVPGPHYETAADLCVLRHLGADCVSMSLPAEIRAAHDTGLGLIAICVITNAAAVSHGEVLRGAAHAGEGLRQLIAFVLFGQRDGA